ncbi:MAG: VTT domain-containing protein [Ornithinimicrobium sp.]
MITLLLTFAVCVVSALVPLVNAEAYIVAVALTLDGAGLWALAFVAGLGQTVGKIMWYEAARQSLSWGWVRRKLETPSRQAALERWRTRFQEQSWLWLAVLFASASAGFPPLLILAVVAGQLHVPRVSFALTVLIGRTVRFALILGGLDWLTEFLLRAS